jgi:hypothetical protein
MYKTIRVYCVYFVMLGYVCDIIQLTCKFTFINVTNNGCRHSLSPLPYFVINAVVGYITDAIQFPKKNCEINYNRSGFPHKRESSKNK